jgi:O-acetyl-ADP-ribose deacetylase (regulator of RNase III)
MEVIHGDLLKHFETGKFDVMVHGCNCFHTMGAGIARQIKTNYPDAFKADLATVKGDKSKLGTYSACKIDLANRFILNAYTQYLYGRGLQVDYDAVKRVFEAIDRDFQDKVIGIPQIGAGLAGGDWAKIRDIIESATTNNRIVLVMYRANK